MKKPFYTGKAKGWLTADGNRLVPTGNPKAAVLFAIPGRKVEPSQIKGISNAHEYFDIPDPAPAAEARPQGKKQS